MPRKAIKDNEPKKTRGRPRKVGGKLVDCPAGYKTYPLTCQKDLSCHTRCDGARDLFGNCYAWNLKTECSGPDTIGRVDIAATNAEIEESFKKFGRDTKAAFEDIGKKIKESWDFSMEDTKKAFQKLTDTIGNEKWWKDTMTNPDTYLLLVTLAFDAASALGVPGAATASAATKIIGKLAKGEKVSLTDLADLALAMIPGPKVPKGVLEGVKKGMTQTKTAAQKLQTIGRNTAKAVNAVSGVTGVDPTIIPGKKKGVDNNEAPDAEAPYSGDTDGYQPEEDNEAEAEKLKAEKEAAEKAEAEKAEADRKTKEAAEKKEAERVAKEKAAKEKNLKAAVDRKELGKKYKRGSGMPSNTALNKFNKETDDSLARKQEFELIKDEFNDARKQVIKRNFLQTGLYNELFDRNRIKLPNTKIEFELNQKLQKYNQSIDRVKEKIDQSDEKPFDEVLGSYGELVNSIKAYVDTSKEKNASSVVDVSGYYNNIRGSADKLEAIFQQALEINAVPAPVEARKGKLITLKEGNIVDNPVFRKGKLITLKEGQPQSEPQTEKAKPDTVYRISDKNMINLFLLIQQISAGYNIQQLESLRGYDALSKAEKKRYDLILSNLKSGKKPFDEMDETQEQALQDLVDNYQTRKERLINEFGLNKQVYDELKGMLEEIRKTALGLIQKAGEAREGSIRPLEAQDLQMINETALEQLADLDDEYRNFDFRTWNQFNAAMERRAYRLDEENAGRQYDAAMERRADRLDEENAGRQYDAAMERRRQRQGAGNARGAFGGQAGYDMARVYRIAEQWQNFPYYIPPNKPVVHMINPRSRVHIPTEGNGDPRNKASYVGKYVHPKTAKGNARGDVYYTLPDGKRVNVHMPKPILAKGNARGGKGLKLKAPPKKAPPKKALPVKPEKSKIDFGKLMKQAEQAQKAAETAVKVGKMVKKMVKKKNKDGQEVEVEEEVLEGGRFYGKPVPNNQKIQKGRGRVYGKPVPNNQKIQKGRGRGGMNEAEIARLQAEQWKQIKPHPPSKLSKDSVFGKYMASGRKKAKKSGKPKYDVI
jgi:hypothetical protein